MARERLRVVAALDGPVVPAWVRRALLELERSDHATLVGVVFGIRPPARAPGGFAFRGYQELDRRLYGRGDDPLAPVDVSALLEGVARGGTPSAARADVLLVLTAAELPADWRSAAPRLGVWSYDHLESERAGGVPFFWEIAGARPVTESALRARTGSGSRLLARSFAATDASSLARGRHAPLWKSAGFVARALRDAVEAPPLDAAAASEPATLAASPPGLPTLLRFGASLASRVLAERVRGRTRSRCWFVALRRSEESLVEGPIAGFSPVPMPGDRFYADPFPVPDGQRLWLFIEDADRASGKGVIRCLEILPDGSVGESRVVLERDYHLSYPFVFQRGGAWYMLPETSEHRTVELWRARDFPWSWELDRVLIPDVKAVDSTLLEHDGRLWLFCGLSETGGDAQDELFVFSADSLDGKWTPHARNPVVSDVRRARPAGRFFREAGALYRPGQDCSGAYGSAICIHRVDRLDAREYRETLVRRIGLDWHPGLVGTHTLQRAGGFDAIDGRILLAHGAPLRG